MYEGAFRVITGTGRCGTMTLANILSLSPTCLGLHEGQIREGMESVARPLPHLTLQNYVAYKNQAEAVGILERYRVAQVQEILVQNPGIRQICDVAYYYAPFTRALRQVFPASRLVLIIRDGRFFVWSAYTAEIPDPMPAGYVDERPLTNHEKFCALGRLRPRAGTPAALVWDSYTPFQKNCWLWTETNRIVLDALESWDPKCVMIVKFEDLFSKRESLFSLLDFLEIRDIEEEQIDLVLAKQLNTRSKKVLPHPSKWSNELKEQFQKIAGPMMDRCGYTY
jgi:hypothetical protein